MADIEITVDGGTSKRLLTGGKYCDKNILVTATGGGGGPEPPDDGKTRLYITIPANSMPGLPPPRNEVPLYIQQSVANGVTIDWGDDSPTETLDGAGNVKTTHTYQTAGDFVISLDPAEGCDLGLGHGVENYCVMGVVNVGNRVYINMLKRVAIANKGAVTISDFAFSECGSLCSVYIMNGITSIGNRSFQKCYSMTIFNIPHSVTMINDYAFYYCSGAKEYHFFSVAPPSLSNENAFSGNRPDCIIYVPVGSLEAYQSATNWSNYASYMREEGT